ncbi:hypothetical protein Tco_1327507 [Tanacetum coccineum]
MFVKYSTGQIAPKKSRGKGSQGKKTTNTPVADVDVSKESDSEPARKRTASKSISSSEAAEEEAARQVHATYARIVTKSVLEPARRRPSGIAFRDTSQVYYASSQKSKKTNRRQPGTRGSSKGTGVSPGVPDESTVIPATLSEGTSTIPGVPDEEKVTSKENVILKWGSEQESKYSKEDQGDDEEVDWIDSNEYEEKKDDTDDDKSIDLEMTDDEFVHGDEQVNDDEDDKMLNAEVEYFGKVDAEISYVAKADAEKIEEIKDDDKKAELPPTSSSLSISLGFGDQCLKLSSNTSLVGTIKDTTDAEINSYWILKSNLKLHISIPKVVEHYLGSKINDDLQKVLQRHTKDLIQKYFVKLTLESSKIQKPTIDLEQEFEKSALEICKIKREQAKKQKMPKYTIKSTDNATLKEYDQKSALYQTMHENKSFNRNPANHALYLALMEALIEDGNAMDKGVADTVKNHKRQHDDDDDDDDADPSAGPNQGKKTKRRRTKELESSKKPSTTKETPKCKALSKGSKTGKSASAKEPVEEPIAEVVMNDAVHTTGEDVVRDDDQPRDTSEPKTNKTPNQDWFKQPLRPPTPDPEWNKRQVALD